MEDVYGKQWLDVDGRCFYTALFFKLPYANAANTAGTTLPGSCFKNCS